MAGLTVLPTIILGVNVTTVTTFSLNNVTTNDYAHNTRPDADICVQCPTNAIARDIGVFFLLFPIYLKLI
ncbi:MAG: DUF3172 domain-containing protein [Nostoc sp. CreGUA01]|nr:DUF3172 domain-containing protein [Nostoc sp. CreGUA01]